MRTVSGVVILTLICMTANAEDAVTIELGGPRRPVATVSETEGMYEIKVSLIPVRSFDPGTNRQRTQEKARSLAVEALVRYRGAAKKQVVTISNAETVEAEYVGARFVLVMHVPCHGVQLLNKSNHTQDVCVPADEKKQCSLVGRRNDSKEMLDALVESLREETRTLEESLDKFYSKVSGVEELGVGRLQLLRMEIKQSSCVLSVEREKLLAWIEAEEARLLKRLRTIVESVENRNTETGN